METRLQTQETIQQLLNGIVSYNKSKINDYNRLSMNIQRDHSLDDYMYIVSHVENHSNILSEEPVNFDEMSDADLLKLEQVLRYTSDFMGLNSVHIPMSTGYRAIEADFPFPGSHFFAPENMLDLLLYLLVPLSRLPRQTEKPFSEMSASEQMYYLQEKHSEGMRPENAGRARGTAAAHLRLLRSYMKLEELFRINEPFMNNQLRDFLNLNENGTDYYRLEEVRNGAGWSEMVSLGSQYHQNEAPKSKVSVVVGQNEYGPIYVEIYNRLNAKFTHTDGREAVFKYPGIYLDDGPDKGTFNYVNAPFPSHWPYDVVPFEKNSPEGYDESTFVYNSGIDGNSPYWRY